MDIQVRNSQIRPYGVTPWYSMQKMMINLCNFVGIVLCLNDEYVFIIASPFLLYRKFLLTNIKRIQIIIIIICIK